jgi:hypothetical protein
MINKIKISRTINRIFTKNSLPKGYSFFSEPIFTNSLIFKIIIASAISEMSIGKRKDRVAFIIEFFVFYLLRYLQFLFLNLESTQLANKLYHFRFCLLKSHWPTLLYFCPRLYIHGFPIRSHHANTYHFVHKY